MSPLTNIFIIPSQPCFVTNKLPLSAGLDNNTDWRRQSDVEFEKLSSREQSPVSPAGRTIKSQSQIPLPCSPAKRPVLGRMAVRTSLGTTGTEPSPSSVSCTASVRRGRRTATTATRGPGSADLPPPPAPPSERTTEGPGTASQTSASTSPSPPAPSTGGPESER